MGKIFAIHSAAKSHLSKILPGNTFDPTDLFSPFSYGVSGVRGQRIGGRAHEGRDIRRRSDGFGLCRTA